MTRGVLYMIWGDNEMVRNVLPRSIQSLKKWHPELEHTVEQMPHSSDLRCKSRMYDLSPYDETLFLDADTVVLGNLDFGFAKARQHGIAMCINVSPWANRYAGLRERGDLVEYDTGVVFWRKDAPGVKDVFDTWRAAFELDSTNYFMVPDGLAHQKYNDQCGFAAAMDQTQFNPFVLPVNWNLHPRWQKTFFGPVRIWHDYNPVPPTLKQWNEKAATAPNICGQLG